MSDLQKGFIAALAGIAFVCWLVMAIMMLLSVAKSGDGCYYRYSYDENGKLVNISDSYESLYLRADGNYNIVDNSSDSSAVELGLDSSSYGKWVRSGVYAVKGSNIDVKVTGEISLCRGYLPKNNLANSADTGTDGKKIPIPRVDEGNIDAIPLVFPAQKGFWSNVLKLDHGDRYLIAIKNEKTTADVVEYDIFSKNNIVADCSTGKNSYSPICGRYSIWGGGDNYVSSCTFNTNACDCISRCEHQYVTGSELDDVCFNQCTCNDFCTDYYGTAVTQSGCKTDYHARKSGYVWNSNTADEVKRFTGCSSNGPLCGAWVTNSASLPAPYNINGSRTIAWTDDLSSIQDKNLNPDCDSQNSYINSSSYRDTLKFWFIAADAAGLLYRIDGSEEPTQVNKLGSKYEFIKILDEQTHYDENSGHKAILEGEYDDKDTAYLQLRYVQKNEEEAKTNGGYVITVKQTKCIRVNGNAFDDAEMEGRGRILYAIVPPGEDPNVSISADALESELTPNVNGSDTIKVPNKKEGYLWFKIANKAEDYKDSFGYYDVSIAKANSNADFFSSILNPFFETLKNKITGISQVMFKNMTCYQKTDQSSCTNFFGYIRAILIIYIITYAMAFLLGKAKINQYDLVVKVAKISIVAGLMNEKTFELFNFYIFDFVTQFSDEIVANMAGYSFISSETSVSNPFMFLNEILTKVFLSQTFIAQMMTLVSMGKFGIFYFILVFIAVAIMVIVAFRAIAVYIMAFVATALLIGIAPLFLTFLLFDSTKYLFDNWVKFTFRYMIEPVIMMVGLIILAQLFTIYLDKIIGYSVCWKCAIPIKLPFPKITGVSPAFLDVELFCINWFAPWGVDHRSQSLGMDLTNIIALMIISYCMWGYLAFAGKLTANLVGSGGGPYATSMGQEVSSTLERGAAYLATGKSAGERADMIKDAKDELKSAIRSDIQSATGKNKDSEQANNSSGEKDDQGSAVGKLGKKWGEKAVKYIQNKKDEAQDDK